MFGMNPFVVPPPQFPTAGYEELIGGLDELDALDRASATTGAWGDAYPALGAWPGAYPAVGLHELVGADPAADFANLMAAAGHYQPWWTAGAGGPPAAPAAALARQMQMARAIDPRAVVVRERAEDTRRVFHVGFRAPADTVAGASGTVTQQPQVTFRSERLIVPSFIAPFFTVDNIIVGKDSQTAVGANPVPATTYSEVAVGVRLELKTANIGHLITIAFTNVDTDDHRFSATMIGTATDVG